jgi:hypothetical protein
MERRFSLCRSKKLISAGKRRTGTAVEEEISENVRRNLIQLSLVDFDIYVNFG